MTKHNISVSRPFLLLIMAIGSGNIYAQTDSRPSESQTASSSASRREERISNADLIKLATKAPLPEKFLREDEYQAAKDAWIKEYPDAYKRIVGESRTAPDAGLGTVTVHRVDSIQSKRPIEPPK